VGGEPPLGRRSGRLRTGLTLHQGRAKSNAITPSRGQSYPAHQRREPRIAAQWLPSEIAVEPDQPVGAFLNRAVEPGKGAVRLPESGIDQCDSIRGDILGLRQ